MHGYICWKAACNFIQCLALTRDACRIALDIITLSIYGAGINHYHGTAAERAFD